MARSAGATSNHVNAALIMSSTPIQSSLHRRHLPAFWASLFKLANSKCSSCKDVKISVYNPRAAATDNVVRQLNSLLTTLRCGGAPATESSRYSACNVLYDNYIDKWDSYSIEDESWSCNSDSDSPSTSQYWSTLDNDSSFANDESDVEISDSYRKASNNSASCICIDYCKSQSLTCTSSPRVSFESAASSCSSATAPLIDRSPLISRDAVYRINQILIQDQEADLLSTNVEISSCSSTHDETIIAESESVSQCSDSEGVELSVWSEEDSMAAFAESVMEMVICRRISREEDLDALFEEFIRVNPAENHATIAKAFLLAMEELQLC